jgi:hypothetical protein
LIAIPPIAAIAIISNIQLGTRHPTVKSEKLLNEIAIYCAKQLENLFAPESATYQILELGWNPDEDRPVTEPTHKKTELKKAIKNYFQHEGVDLDKVENPDEEKPFPEVGEMGSCVPDK